MAVIPFKPNYDDDLGKVFLKTTSFALSTEEWFHLLCFGGRGYESWNHLERSKSKGKLPSWVPNYSSDMVVGMRFPSIHGILKGTKGEYSAFRLRWLSNVISMRIDAQNPC